MNGKKTLILLTILLISSILFYFISNKSAPKTEQVQIEEKKLRFPGESVSPVPMAMIGESSFGNLAESIFYDKNMISDVNELLELARKGKINLVSELWAMRRKCPEDYRFEQCNNMLSVFIDKNFPPPGNETLKKLLSKYLKYEIEMRDFKTPENLKLSERYELIKQKRRELFSEEEAKLIFGLEESKVTFSEASRNFYKETKDLSGEERIKKYEELKKTVYGDYYSSMKERETPFNNYEVEISLRENDFKKLKDDDKKQKMIELQTKYFGKEGAERIQKVYAQLEEEKQKESEYTKAEEKFLKDNTGLSEEDKTEKLKALRIQYMGEQGAEEYIRRKQYEESLKNKKTNK
ncbi:MAG: lipase chaperone [Leptospiraceae bacterium]|nr:lipase chaperone [Leptospiraceae bacterium]